MQHSSRWLLMIFTNRIPPVSQDDCKIQLSLTLYCICAVVYERIYAALKICCSWLWKILHKISLCDDITKCGWTAHFVQHCSLFSPWFTHQVPLCKKLLPKSSYFQFVVLVDVLYTGEDGEACTEAIAAEYSDNHLTTHGRRWENTRHSLSHFSVYVAYHQVERGTWQSFVSACLLLVVLCCVDTPTHRYTHVVECVFCRAIATLKPHRAVSVAAQRAHVHPRLSGMYVCLDFRPTW